MTPEGKVKAKVKKILDAVGAYWTMPVTGGYGSSGAPDFLVCHRGKFFGIECKANGNKPTALQEDNMRRIEASGGFTLVVDETTIVYLENFLEINSK
jgi:hypothetical protein